METSEVLVGANRAAPAANRTLGSIKVRPYQAQDAERWDRFVLAHPAGSPFHLSAWQRTIERTFPYTARYFGAERDGEIVAVAPLFHISNWVVGRCLLSTPLAVYGGICAQDEESKGVLLRHLQQYATSENVDYLELRNRTSGPLAGFHPNRLYVTFTTLLSSNRELMWKQLPRDTRYMIRKGKKAGLTTRSGLEQLRDFYQLFTLSMRRLGTPVFPFALFENLAEEYSGKADLLLVYAGSRPVAGVFSLVHRDTILPYYAGASADARELAANNFMYWKLMEHAAEIGLERFDFGRSKKGSGSYDFKVQWNMQIEPLDYQVFLVRRKSAPSFSPASPKFRLAARFWRLLPLCMANLMGPHVVRWFP